jgi:hypothetical protein
MRQKRVKSFAIAVEAVEAAVEVYIYYIGRKGICCVSRLQTDRGRYGLEECRRQRHVVVIRGAAPSAVFNNNNNIGDFVRNTVYVCVCVCVCVLYTILVVKSIRRQTEIWLSGRFRNFLIGGCFVHKQ